MIRELPRVSSGNQRNTFQQIYFATGFKVHQQVAGSEILTVEFVVVGKIAGMIKLNHTEIVVTKVCCVIFGKVAKEKHIGIAVNNFIMFGDQ